MPVRDTSIVAVRELNRTGRAASLRAIIHAAVKHNGAPMTRNEISVRTGLPINTVSGRVNQLVKIGMLIDLPYVMTPSGRPAHPVSADVREVECKNCKKILYVYRPDPVPVLGYLCSDECQKENREFHK